MDLAKRKSYLAIKAEMTTLTERRTLLSYTQEKARLNKEAVDRYLRLAEKCQQDGAAYEAECNRLEEEVAILALNEVSNQKRLDILQLEREAEEALAAYQAILKKLNKR